MAKKTDLFPVSVSVVVFVFTLMLLLTPNAAAETTVATAKGDDGLSLQSGNLTDELPGICLDEAPCIKIHRPAEYLTQGDLNGKRMANPLASIPVIPLTEARLQQNLIIQQTPPLMMPLDGEKKVFFNDANLELVIRYVLDKPAGDITRKEMGKITDLFAPDRGIEDLSGLEYAINLRFLNLNWNYVSDLSPLAGLTGLQRLDIWYNQVRNIRPLANLLELKELDCGDNLISDLTPLANLVKLEMLDLSNNQSSDLTPLANMANLQGLSISNNQISELGSLAHLRRLEWLYLNDNQVADLTPLARLGRLQELEFSNNKVRDLTPLANLSALQWLAFSRNNVSDISVLGGLLNLINLEMENNYIDLSTGSPAAAIIEALRGRNVDIYYTPQLKMPLNGDNTVFFNDINLEIVVRDVLGKPYGDITENDMAKITDLQAYHQEIEDLSGLEYAINLHFLNLDWNLISNLAPLANLTELQVLSLWYNHLSDLSPLANLVNLEELDCGRNGISDLAPLANLVNLQALYFEENRVNDLGPLANLTNLQWLGCWDNRVSDLAPLVNLTELLGLFAGSNRLSDLTPLANLTHLQWLMINDNRLSDLAPLAQLAFLELNVADNYLDLKQGSFAMNLIKSLLEEGVEIYYLPQWKPWPAEQNVAADKKWTLKLNKKLDEITLLDENIYVTGEDRIRHDVMLFTDDGITIEVIPLKHYRSGETYTLFIKDLMDKSGNLLSNNIKMKFTIK